MNQEITYRKTDVFDRTFIEDLMVKEWKSTRVVSRGKVHNVLALPSIIAEYGEQKVGLLNYVVDSNGCEIVSLIGLIEGKGVGSGLLLEVEKIAKKSSCNRIWLVTTNDNKHALDFYRKNGYIISAVHRNAIDDSRKLKPEIPLIGLNGIPIRDEIELEKAL